VTTRAGAVIQAACDEMRRGEPSLPISKHMDNVMVRRGWDTLLHHMF
jgi:hypothetical protein